MLITYLLLTVGIWFISNSFLMKTKNCKSSLIFKVIPFLLGLSSIICFLGRIGVLNGIN